MAKKEFTYKGKTVSELKQMSIEQFAELVPARVRRSLKRGLTDAEKILVEKIKDGEKDLHTHCRDTPILPLMIGQRIAIYNGKEFLGVEITEEMIGHVLGEFVMTRKKVAHSAPGIGATKSSASISVK